LRPWGVLQEIEKGAVPRLRLWFAMAIGLMVVAAVATHLRLQALAH
jgi:hypothetical protein